MKNSPTRRPVQTKLFAPVKNSGCLCGSGDKFKQCCAGNLPSFDIRKKFQAAAETGDYKTALIAARSDVTQYTIWHKTNTAPLVRAFCGELPEPICKLLSIDIDALRAHVESLSRCYNRLNRTDEFPAVLERLRSNIDHPRWHRKIAYLHALHAIGKNWENREAGKKELRKLGSMDEEFDVEILQLYIDLFGTELGFSTRQILIERIARLAEEPAERLHYQGLSAINLLMVGDQEGATNRLQSAIYDYSDVRDEDNESAYALTFYATALEVLGQIQQDKLMLDKALALFRQLVVRDDLNKTGTANAYSKLGDALRYGSLWQEAKDAYSTAFEHEPHDILKVFISQCLLYLKDLKSAKQMMSTIEISTLSAHEVADYIFTFAQIAIESGEKEDLVKAEQELRSLEIVAPYFKQHQNALLLSIVDTLRAGTSKNRAVKLRGILNKASIFLRYIILEPSIMGIGLNVGKVLEDVTGHKTAPKKK